MVWLHYLTQASKPQALKMLKIYTQFELITAGQLCLDRGRDEPNEKDLADSVKLCVKWNNQRIKLGLRPWK